MLKKIKPSDVRLGMYIEEIRGNWLEHPFWRKSFKISEQKDLDKLINCGLDEIWIDTSKGLDVAVSEQTQTANAVNPDSEKPKAETPKAEKPHPPKKVSVGEEMDAAKKIHKKAKEAVTTMFSDVRMGKALEIEEAVSLVDEINQSMERNSNALLSLVRLKTVMSILIYIPLRFVC